MGQRTNINSAGVVGAGYMGRSIAMVLAIAGIEVAMLDQDARATREHLGLLRDEAQQLEDANIIPEGSAGVVSKRVRPAVDILDCVAGADFVEEAIFEDLTAKREALAAIDAVAPPSTIIATNTSAIPIGDLATVLTHPERLLAVHFMNPASVMAGVEVIPHATTDPAVVDAAMELMRRCGKRPAQVPDTPGFVVNRLQFALFREACLMVSEGVAPEVIDTVVPNTFGFRLALYGPFTLADMAGLDIYAAAYETLEAAYGPRFSAPDLLTEMVAAGKLGAKTGGAFYPMPTEDIAARAAKRDLAYANLAIFKQRIEE